MACSDLEYYLVTRLEEVAALLDKTAAGGRSAPANLSRARAIVAEAVAHWPKADAARRMERPFPLPEPRKGCPPWPLAHAVVPPPDWRG